MRDGGEYFARRTHDFAHDLLRFCVDAAVSLPSDVGESWAVVLDPLQFAVFEHPEFEAGRPWVPNDPALTRTVGELYDLMGFETD
jgi:hypothetical protein